MKECSSVYSLFASSRITHLNCCGYHLILWNNFIRRRRVVGTRRNLSNLFAYELLMKVSFLTLSAGWCFAVAGGRLLLFQDSWWLPNNAWGEFVFGVEWINPCCCDLLTTAGELERRQECAGPDYRDFIQLATICQQSDIIYLFMF